MPGSGFDKGTTCPRCGREHDDPAMPLCEQCRAALLRDGNHDSLTLEVGPILAQAQAAIGPGEDFDEALLRVLKQRHPEYATGLFSAVTRLIEAEEKQSGEQREEVVRRLVARAPAPTLQIRTSRSEITSGSLMGSDFSLGASETTSERTVIRIGNEEYHSLEEVPPHLRPMIERGMSRARRDRPPIGTQPTQRGVRLGCSWAVISALLRR